MAVTLATSQFSSAWLKFVAWLNMLLWGEVQSSVRANQPNTRAGEQQQRTHNVCVTFATSQLPSASLKFVALENMELWEEVESSVRANQQNTRADEQQQRTHAVVVTFATSQLPSA